MTSELGLGQFIRIADVQIHRKTGCSNICGALCDLVAFVQFKKREKHPWRSFNFSKVAGFCDLKSFMKAIKAFIKPFEAPQKPATLLKLTRLHGCVSRFLNCTNGT